MERRAKRDEGKRGLVAALVVIVPALLAGCQERPAYVIDPERSAASYPAEHPYYTVTVREGDSISKIAARCDTTGAEIADLNDIDEWADLYPGQVLRVPSRPRDERPREDVAYVPHPVPRPHYTPAGYEEPRVTPKPRQQRYDDDAQQGASNSGDNSWWSWWMRPSEAAPEDTGSMKFIWPVQGRIIEGFGGSRHGERNDGINIATQEGAPIRAAAAGTVTYTGNELKGYGNLVLIRHDNGYVTAYAHAGSIRVSRGDIVERGQIIGTAGETGDVDRPQLHFEIRKGVQAVDPVQYLNRAS
ncbi:MAG TPA: M23 family metallopeptidase [Rhizomicrobium sp.]|nr:M23 family metallopeptidase [Rhizomicrobium sp.]